MHIGICRDRCITLCCSTYHNLIPMPSSCIVYNLHTQYQEVLGAFVRVLVWLRVHRGRSCCVDRSLWTVSVATWVEEGVGGYIKQERYQTRPRHSITLCSYDVIKMHVSTPAYFHRCHSMSACCFTKARTLLTTKGQSSCIKLCNAIVYNFFQLLNG